MTLRVRSGAAHDLPLAYQFRPGLKGPGGHKRDRHINEPVPVRPSAINANGSQAAEAQSSQIDYLFSIEHFTPP